MPGNWNVRSNPPVAGLLHTVLPERTNGNDPLSLKYVDSGIAILLDTMIKAGARDFVVKPFERERVLNAINKHLG